MGYIGTQERIMNYLITGGTGLIGKELITKLGIKNDNVTVLTRDIKKAQKLFPPKVKLIEKLSSKALENIEIVINLAGEPIADKRWSVAQKLKICHSRWNITKELNLLINQAANPPKLFISGSAIGVYGRQNKLEIDENFKAFNQEFTHEVCSTWEQLALDVPLDRTRVAILRTGIVLAKNGGALAKMLPPFKMGVGGKISHGEQMMSWIHIEDMIAAILHIIDNDALEGAINITAPLPVSNSSFSSTLASKLKRPCFITTPAWLLKAVFGEMSELLLFGQNVIPAKLLASGFSFKYETVEEALEEIVNQ
jgi:uncharacterized protein (TIGR01777 family)